MDGIIVNFFHSFAGRHFLSDWLIIFFAEYLGYCMVAALAYVLWKTVKDWRRAWYYAATGVLAVILARGLVTEGVRFFYYRPRPFAAFNFAPLINEVSGSFPSGHAAFFFALVPLAFLLGKKAGYWFVAASLLMAFARIAAGVHWPSDILGGIAIGLASFWIIKLALPAFGQEIDDAPL